MSAVLFFVGCLVWAALARWWRPQLRWSVAVAYALVSLTILGPSLLTSRHQVATDMVFRWRPWSEMTAEKVAPKNVLLADPVLQMLPLRTIVRRHLLAGDAPLWAHELGTGQPLLGDAQSAPFSPFHLAALPLDPLDAMAVAAAWQLFAALLLTHCLMLHLGAGPVGAAFAALTFGLSCFAAVWLFYPLGMTAVWAPGLLLAVGLMARGERGGVPGFVVCSWAMAACGHPETAAHVGILVGVVVAVLAVQLPRDQTWRFLRSALVAGALAAVLAIPILGPVLEALPESQRAAELASNPSMVAGPAFQTPMLIPVVSPFFFGSPRDGNWSGPWNFSELVSEYAGTLPLILAIFGALFLGGRVRAIALGGGVALLLALGLRPIGRVLELVPVVGQAAHGRLRFVWVLAIAIAAGLTLDHLRKHPPAAWRRLALLGLVIAMALAIVVWAPPAQFWERAWWIVALLGLGAFALVTAIPRGRAVFGVVAIGVLFVDLLLVGYRYNPVLPEAAWPSLPTALGNLVTARAEEPFRFAAEEWDFPANLPAVFGLWDPRGNDPMRPVASARYVARHLEGSARPEAWTRLRPGRFDFAALDRLAVRYLLTPHRRVMPPPWTVLLDDQGGKVWLNPAAKPIFFVTGEAGRVEAIHPVANGFRLRVSAAAPFVVASSVSFARPWRLWIDDERKPLLSNGGPFLRFQVPGGSHDVFLNYRPATWRWGWLAVLSLLSFCAARAALRHFGANGLRG